MPVNPWRAAAVVAAFRLAGIGALSTGLLVAAFGFRADVLVDPALALRTALTIAIVLMGLLASLRTRGCRIPEHR